MPVALEYLGKKVTIRTAPDVRSTTLTTLPPYSDIEYEEIVDDAHYPHNKNYKWFKLAYGYCNYIYPPAGERFLLNPKYGVVLHDFEIHGKSRPELNNSPARILGLPETQKLLDNNSVPLTRELQEFWFNLMKLSYPKSEYSGELTYEKYMKNAFKSLTHGGRAVTNFKGWNNGYANYVSGINVNAEPMGFEPIVMGGALVQILGKFYKYRRWWYKIRTIAANQPLPDINQYTAPYLVYNATISLRRVIVNHIRQVDPFPQLDGRDVPIPIFSRTGSNAIKAEVVRILEDGEAAPYPYVR